MKDGQLVCGASVDAKVDRRSPMSHDLYREQLLITIDNRELRRA